MAERGDPFTVSEGTGENEGTFVHVMCYRIIMFISQLCALDFACTVQSSSLKLVIVTILHDILFGI